MAWNQSRIMGPIHIPKRRDSAGNVIEWLPGYHLLVGDEALVSVDLAAHRQAEENITDMPVVFAGTPPIVLTFAGEPEARASDLAQYWGDEPEGGYEQPVPASVSPAQMRIALKRQGLLEQADGFAASLDEEAQIRWQRATQIDRDNELIGMAARGLGMSSAQVDDLFRLAASL